MDASTPARIIRNQAPLHESRQQHKERNSSKQLKGWRVGSHLNPFSADSCRLSFLFSFQMGPARVGLTSCREYSCNARDIALQCDQDEPSPVNTERVTTNSSSVRRAPSLRSSLPPTPFVRGRCSGNTDTDIVVATLAPLVAGSRGRITSFW